MQAFQFDSKIKQYRWGGRQLGTVLGKPIGPDTDYAESWEIVDHQDDQSEIMEGPYKGWTLNQIVQENREELLGFHSTQTQFPLLIKFLDCTDRLSVQVHPNNEQALQYREGENGKTEAWVVLQTSSESILYAGLKAGVTKEKLSEAISNGSIEECLHSVRPKPGDCFFIPAGTVHALGEGIILAEIQQSSDLTFRLHDWGRVDRDGNQRPLHLNDALNCIDYTRGPVDAVVPVIQDFGGVVLEELVSCEYFQIQRWDFKTSHQIKLENRFHIVIGIEGSGRLVCDREPPIPIRLGQTVLLPAACKTVRFEPETNSFLKVLVVS